MLKKNHLAVAIAVASGGVALANAATVTVPNQQTYTAEAIVERATVGLATAAVAFTSDVRSLNGDDTLTLDFGTALVSRGSTNALTTVADLVVDVKSALVASGLITSASAYTTYATNGTMAGRVIGGTKLSYVFDTGNEPKTSSNTVALSVGSFQVITPEVFVKTPQTSVTLAASYDNPGSTIPAESASGAVLATVASQMAGGAFSGDKVIDVNALRKTFTGSATSASFALSFDKDKYAAALGYNDASTTGSVAIVISGDDFSWLDTDATTVGTQLAAGSITTDVATSTDSISEDSKTITVNLASGDALKAESVTVTLDNTDERAIAVNTGISATAQIFYGSGARKSSTTVPLTGTAKFTLNGSSVDIYAVPQSTNVSNFIWMTNTGSGTAGENVTVSIYDGSSTPACVLENVAQTIPGKELDLTKAIADNLASCTTYTPTGNRVRYNVTTNAPATDIRISAAYRVGTDRVNLITSSETESNPQ